MTSDAVEYPQGAGFPGVIGRTVEESSPAWPAPIRARDGAPNVLFVVLDDVGYGQLSCFGGMVGRVLPKWVRETIRFSGSICPSSRSGRPVRVPTSGSRSRPRILDIAHGHLVRRDLLSYCLT